MKKPEGRPYAQVYLTLSRRHFLQQTSTMQPVRHPSTHKRTSPSPRKEITPNANTNHKERNLQSLLRGSRTLSTGLIRPALFNSPLARPDVFNAPPVAPGLVSISLCPVIPLCRKTLVHLPLDVIAIAHCFVEESACVAFVQRGHDFFAVWWGRWWSAHHTSAIDRKREPYWHCKEYADGNA